MVSVNERLLEAATVEAILEAPVSELRPKPHGYGRAEYAPAFWQRVRRIYKEMVAKAAIEQHHIFHTANSPQPAALRLSTHRGNRKQ